MIKWIEDKKAQLEHHRICHTWNHLSKIRIKYNNYKLNHVLLKDKRLRIRIDFFHQHYLQELNQTTRNLLNIFPAFTYLMKKVGINQLFISMVTLKILVQHLTFFIYLVKECKCMFQLLNIQVMAYIRHQNQMRSRLKKIRRSYMII